jgi:DNA-binding NarL/FixJ family response regulator/anti-sigma regulatory factor (Ser/Thr protein kinase)
LVHAVSARLRVLLVDDVPDLRLLLRSLFSAYPGIEVVGEAGNGLEGIELARRFQPDLVVLDVSMPLLDGVAALPKIREASPGSRVVVLTAIPKDLNPGAIEAGAVAYVEKSAAATAHLIEDLLMGGGLLDSAVTEIEDALPTGERTFDRHPASAGRARAFARDLIGDDSAVLETVQLLLSELVTNAVLHAASEPKVAIQVLRDRVHIEIVDSSTGSATPRAAGRKDESGRGLGIVDALAQSWGTTPLPDGKVVWFDVAR